MSEVVGRIEFGDNQGNQPTNQGTTPTQQDAPEQEAKVWREGDLRFIRAKEGTRLTPDQLVLLLEDQNDLLKTTVIMGGLAFIMFSIFSTGLNLLQINGILKFSVAFGALTTAIAGYCDMMEVQEARVFFGAGGQGERRLQVGGHPTTAGLKVFAIVFLGTLLLSLFF